MKERKRKGRGEDNFKDQTSKEEKEMDGQLYLYYLSSEWCPCCCLCLLPAVAEVFPKLQAVTTRFPNTSTQRNQTF